MSDEWDYKFHYYKVVQEAADLADEVDELKAENARLREVLRALLLAPELSAIACVEKDVAILALEKADD